MGTKDNAVAKLYIGLDIHKRSWKIQLATDLFWGKSLSVPPDAEAIKKFVDKHYANHAVFICYESGCCGFSHHRYFESYGWTSLVVNPGDIAKTASARYKKTDKIDARMLCKELKDNRLHGIHVPDTNREALRCMFRRRLELVKEYRKVKTQLLMRLLYLGIKIPEEHDNSNWTHAFRDWIRGLDLGHACLDFSFRSRMRSFDFVDEELRDVSTKLRAHCRKHYKDYYYLLRSIPGIGGIVAVGIISELGDLKRFKNFKQLAGYVGMCPSIRQSGDSEKHFGMTPRAHKLMRSYFVEASWQALRFDPVMQAYFRKHQGKDSKRILIKVARKLLSRTYGVVKSGMPYEIGVVE